MPLRQIHETLHACKRDKCVICSTAQREYVVTSVTLRVTFLRSVCLVSKQHYVESYRSFAVVVEGRPFREMNCREVIISACIKLHRSSNHEFQKRLQKKNASIRDILKNIASSVKRVDYICNIKIVNEFLVNY